jgi:phosphoglycerol transferase MdoB-like AlkP superfamily enzyme
VFYSGGAPNHVAKIILASILFIFTAITAVARWNKKDLFYSRSTKALYVAAYFVSFAIASVLGFLGGVILFGM